MAQTPVFFISHGSPTLAIEPGLLGPRLQALGQQLTGLRAVLVVSPHWQTHEVTVMTTAQPTTLHDFGGFAQALYQLRYPANGQPDCAREAARLLQQAGYAPALDDQRGLDHGAWVPLLHLLPVIIWLVRKLATLLQIFSPLVPTPSLVLLPPLPPPSVLVPK